MISVSQIEDRCVRTECKQRNQRAYPSVTAVIYWSFHGRNSLQLSRLVSNVLTQVKSRGIKLEIYCLTKQRNGLTHLHGLGSLSLFMV